MQRHNWLLVADTQQQVAASRRMLRAGQRQRYRSKEVPRFLAIAATFRSKRLAQLASLFWGTIPSARAVFERASRRWPAFGVPSSGCVVGGHSARAQLALPCWGSNPGARVGSAPVWSRSGHIQIQPRTRERHGGKSCVSALPWLALASAASDNRLFVADMQQQKAASRHVLPAGQRQR